MENRMNIHYLSFSRVPSRDANSVQVMKMCNALSQAGHSVTLFAKRDSFSFSETFRYYNVPNSFRINRSFAPRVHVVGDIIHGLTVLWKLVRTPPPDLYYGRHPHLMFLASFTDVPLVYEAHDVPRLFLQASMEARMFRSKRFSRLIVSSDALRQEYLRLFPHLKSQSVIVAHNGTNIPRDIYKKPLIRKREGAIQIGYTGHLYPGRGMEIIGEIARRVPDADIHIIGGMDEYIAEWKRRHTLRNIHFYGHVPHNEVHGYLAQFNILLAPYQKKVTIGGGKGDTSRWMSPLKIFEYMAARKAIIVSRLPVIAEVLQDGNSAIFVDPEDKDGWVAAVRRLREDPQRVRSLADNAYRRFCQYHTWNKRAERILKGIDV